MQTFSDLIERTADSWRVDLTEGREIQLFPWGTWHHEEYGEMTFDAAFFAEMEKNFTEQVRGQRIPIDSEHMADPMGAKGYINRLIVRDGVGMFAAPEWTDYGRQLPADKRFLYMSPTFLKKWTHPQTGESYSNVLIGAALTTMPYLKGMSEVALSEKMVQECADVKTATPAGQDEDINSLFEKWDALGCQIEERLKSKKGVPMARHQFKMSKRLLEEMLSKHFPKQIENNESDVTTTMADETTIETVVELKEDAEKQALTEKLARAEAALLAERQKAQALKDNERSLKVQMLSDDLQGKDLLKSGMVDNFKAFALKFAAENDTTNEVRLSEGTEQSNFLSELKSTIESCCFSMKMHEKA